MIILAVVIDHVFICVSAGGAQAERLRRFGLTEGSPNRHPGQGTACRRFFFQNAMLELLWVEDAMEARSEPTRRTKLYDRWAGAGYGASPFGIILCLEPGRAEPCPFPSWEYRPAGMPDLVLQIADVAGLEDPMWCYMDTRRTPAEAPPERRQPLEHPIGLQDLTGVRIVCPALAGNSVTSAMAAQGVIALGTGAEHLMELQFDGGRKGRRIDFRPDLPLVFRW
jgi:hypothetical protein